MKGPFETQVLGVRTEASVSARVEVFADGVEDAESDKLVEECNRAFELHFQGPVVHGSDAESLDRHLLGIDGFGVFHVVQDEGVLGGVDWIHDLAPREDEIVRGNRLAVAPARVLPQPERRALGPDVPPLGNAGNKPVGGVIAEQPFHDVAENEKADLVGRASRVELWGLL